MLQRVLLGCSSSQYWPHQEESDIEFHQTVIRGLCDFPIYRQQQRPVLRLAILSAGQVAKGVELSFSSLVFSAEPHTVTSSITPVLEKLHWFRSTSDSMSHTSCVFLFSSLSEGLVSVVNRWSAAAIPFWPVLAMCSRVYTCSCNTSPCNTKRGRWFTTMQQYKPARNFRLSIQNLLGIPSVKTVTLGESRLAYTAPGLEQLISRAERSQTITGNFWYSTDLKTHLHKKKKHSLMTKILSSIFSAVHSPCSRPLWTIFFRYRRGITLKIYNNKRPSGLYSLLDLLQDKTSVALWILAM